MLKLIGDTITKAAKVLTMRELWREAEALGEVEVKSRFIGRGQQARIWIEAADGVRVSIYAEAGDPETALLKAVTTARQVVAGGVCRAS